MQEATSKLVGEMQNKREKKISVVPSPISGDHNTIIGIPKSLCLDLLAKDNEGNNYNIAM